MKDIQHTQHTQHPGSVPLTAEHFLCRRAMMTKEAAKQIIMSQNHIQSLSILLSIHRYIPGNILVQESQIAYQV